VYALNLKYRDNLEYQSQIATSTFVEMQSYSFIKKDYALKLLQYDYNLTRYIFRNINIRDLFKFTFKLLFFTPFLSFNKDDEKKRLSSSIRARQFEKCELRWWSLFQRDPLCFAQKLTRRNIMFPVAHDARETVKNQRSSEKGELK